MRDEDRLNRNPMGRDPANLAEINEPRYGYGPTYRYLPPSPKAARLMEECISFSQFWLNSAQHAADRKWKREDAVQRHMKNKARCRQLNIEMLREYLSNLRGENKMRAYRSIANLEALSRA